MVDRIVRNAQARAMDAKPTLLVRRYSASAAGMMRPAVGKTALERMQQVTELGRRGRLMERLARRDRVNDANRAR